MQGSIRIPIETDCEFQRAFSASFDRLPSRLTKLPLGQIEWDQGVSPFLFTFRLVAFNYASYPVLSMPCGPAWTCSGGVARSSRVQETSPLRVHSAPGAVRFCCRAGPPGPPPCVGPPASRRGDFPQCRTLSATLLLPHTHGRRGLA